MPDKPSRRRARAATAKASGANRGRAQQTRRGLTARQAAFAREYQVDFNATAAAIRAGYSKRSAKEIGYELLQRRDVQELIEQAQGERSDRLDVTVDNVVRELARIGFSRMTDFVSFRENLVRLKDSDALTEDAVAAIAEIREHPATENSGATISFKLHNKLGALELLCKHLGIGSDKLDAKVTATVESMLDRVRVRMIASGKAAAFDEFVDALDVEQSALGLPPVGTPSASGSPATPAAGPVGRDRGPGEDLH